MGKVMSVISRPVKNFNIESRAHKVISKEKPVAAPIHQANIKEAEKLLRDNPESLTQLMKKDTILDAHLKDIYVKSYDPDPVSVNNIELENLNRPLPLNRRIVPDLEFGFLEPKVVPPGKCTLRQILKLLSSYQSNPDSWDSAKEALNYNIPEETLKNIIHYFRVYHVYVPDKTSKFVYGTPELPQERLESGDKQNV